MQIIQYDSYQVQHELNNMVKDEQASALSTLMFKSERKNLGE